MGVTPADSVSCAVDYFTYRITLAISTVQEELISIPIILQNHTRSDIVHSKIGSPSIFNLDQVVSASQGRKSFTAVREQETPSLVTFLFLCLFQRSFKMLKIWSMVSRLLNCHASVD